MYEPHPFLVGEIAEEQRGGYFSFVRGAGVEGYKLGAESVTITIPAKADKMDQQFSVMPAVSCWQTIRIADMSSSIWKIPTLSLFMESTQMLPTLSGVMILRFRNLWRIKSTKLQSLVR